MNRFIQDRKVFHSIKKVDAESKKEYPKRVDFVLHEKKKTLHRGGVSKSQLDVGSVKDIPVRVFTIDQIAELNQYCNISYDLNRRSNKKLAWSKLKNAVLGITEKELLCIEKREWNKLYQHGTDVECINRP